MKSKNQNWFTLIELLIAITILLIMSMMTFAPYSFYMNKWKVKYTNKEISQAIYEAKNMAVNWSATQSWNISVWLYFENNWIEKFSYNLLSFEHDIWELSIQPVNGKLLEKHNLQPWIQIDSFAWDNKWLIFFRSITGSWIIFKWDPLLKVPYTESENEIVIEYSYKGSSNSVLQNSLTYFQDTQIIDY
jgi:type II secretory pathway pseudopilin PulG